MEFVKKHIWKVQNSFNIQRLQFVTENQICKMLYMVLLYDLDSISLDIEALEIYLYWRILNISWASHTSNAEVLTKLNKERELLTLIKRRKTAYIGHVMRNNTYQLLQSLLQGKIEGRRRMERKPMSWLWNIRHWTGFGRCLLDKTTDRKTLEC